MKSSKDLIFMIIGIGTDIIEISRIKKAVQTRSKMLEKIFSERELEYCQGKGDFFASLAVRFAAKEAVGKAVGTGIRNFKWRDIEITNDELGRPSVILHGGAKERYQFLGGLGISLSLSHCKDYAVAMVVIEGG